MEELIEGFYGYDGKTAYVMSSDHGMTDWGKVTLLLLAENSIQANRCTWSIKISLLLHLRQR